MVIENSVCGCTLPGYLHESRYQDPQKGLAFHMLVCTKVSSMQSDHKTNTLPPVFVAALCPDIFTRLDAKIAERTRIPNAGLHERMRAQERLLNNYKSYMMKRHEEEVEKIRLDQKRLMKCSPGLDPKTLRPMFQKRQICKGKKTNVCHKDVKQCQRCYIHHTPCKDVYYQNWWLRNMAAEKEIIKLKFCQRYH